MTERELAATLLRSQRLALTLLRIETTAQATGRPVPAEALDIARKARNELHTLRALLGVERVMRNPWG